MSLEKVFTINADTKEGSYEVIDNVVQNDSVVFIINITEDGLPKDLTDVTTYALAHTRADNNVVVTPGAKTGDNQVTFNLGSNEISVPGRVIAAVQLYDASGRVSTSSFTYSVVKDPTGDGFVPSEEEKTLIQTVLGDGPVILQQAQVATDNANTVAEEFLSDEADRVAAELTRVSNENTRNTNETARVSAESFRSVEESARNTAETSRSNAESARATAESARATAETARATAETARSTAETTRSTNETTRQTNETTRQTQETSRQTAIGNISHKGPYNAATAYVVNNSVQYNGSTYRCIQNTTGNLPTNATYWTLEAAAGSVASVSSANSDISVANPSSTPTLTLNSSVAPAADTIVKRGSDSSIKEVGLLSDLTTTDKTSVVKAINEVDAQIISAAPTPVTLNNGLQVLNTTKSGLLQNFNAKGRTLSNMAARSGNLGEVSIDNHGSNVSAWAADSSVYTTGSSSYKATTTAASGNRYIQKYFNAQLVSGNYYIMLLDLRRSAAGSISPSVRDGTSFNSTGMTGSKSINVALAANTWTTALLKWQQTTTEAVNLVVDDIGADAIDYWVDGVRIYQVSQNDYNALTAGIVDAATAAKYQYEDDVKHLNGLYVIRYGENLVPPASEWTIHPQAKINEPYSITLTATAASQGSYATIQAVPNQQYTFGVSAVPSAGFYYAVQLRRADMTLISEPVDITSSSSSTSSTFTTTSDTAFIQIYVTNSATSGTYTFSSNIRLNVGTVDKGFKQRNDDMMAFPVSLAASIDGIVYDQIFHRDGRFWRENRFQKDVILDGSLGWFYFGTNPGVKNISFPLSAPPVNDTSYNLFTKFDGKPLVTKLDATWNASADCSRVVGGNIYISTSSADTGWGDNYTPSTPEIQAYMNGWKMGTSGASNTAYNGTGTKTWGTPRTDGFLDNQTSVVPTALAPVWSTPSKWQPYKLTYQLATPTLDDLTELMEGEINLLEGFNQIEVGAGIILKEKNVPSKDGGGSWNINNPYATNGSNPSQLRWRAGRFLAVYKNGAVDPRWSFTNQAFTPFGRITQLDPSGYDSSAVYEVTYQAVDQYLLTSTPISVTGEYDTNIKTIQDRTSQRISDLTQRLSVAEMLSARTYRKPDMSTQDTNYYVDATNGSDGNDGSASRPFKTIQKAVNQIPQIVNHMYYIYVAPGTYNEDVIVNGFITSGLPSFGQVKTIVFSAINPTQGATNVNSFNVYNCNGRIEVNGFTATSTSMAGFNAYYSNRVMFVGCFITTTSGSDGFSFVYSNGRVQGGIASNRRFGIIAQYSSMIYVMGSVTGSGNYYGMASTIASYIGSDSTSSILGTSGWMTTSAGGMFVPNSGVINPWGDNTYVNRSSVLCWSSAGLTLTSSATWYKMPINNKTSDQLSEFDTTLYRFTAKHSGLYLVSASAEITNLVSGDRVYLVTYKNGVQVSFLGDIQYSNYGSHIVGGTDQIILNAGDYIELYLFSLVSGGKSLGNNSNTNWFRITQIA